MVSHLNLIKINVCHLSITNLTILRKNSEKILVYKFQKELVHVYQNHSHLLLVGNVARLNYSSRMFKICKNIYGLQFRDSISGVV